MRGRSPFARRGRRGQQFGDAAEGLVGSTTPLGIIPLGTANVFAREIGLPLSPEQVTSTLLYGTARAIPVALINARPFLFVVGSDLMLRPLRTLKPQAPVAWARQAFLVQSCTHSPLIPTMYSA